MGALQARPNSEARSVEHADERLAALDTESEQARRAAVAALGKFESAVGVLRESAAASAWVSGGVHDQRFGRRPITPHVGSVARSSARVTANSEAIDVPTLIGYLREAVELPQPTPTPLAQIPQAS